MAVLKPDGEIYYRSVAEFLTDYDTHISKGGLYLDSQHDWPLRNMLTFTIRTEGIESTLELLAEVVFLGENKVGLQLHDAPKEKKNLEAYWSQVQALGKEVPETKSPAAPEPAGSPEDQEETLEISGQIVAPRNLDEFRSASPIELGSPEFRSITFFKLLASIVAARTALALTILHKEDQLCFRFNAKGNLVQFIAPGAGKDLLERLVHERLISRHVQQEVLDELIDKKFAEAILLERKVVKLADLWAVVRSQVIDTFEEIRSQSGASYRIDAINTGRRTGVSFGSLIIPWMGRALKELDKVQLDKLLEPMWDRYPVMHADPIWPVSSLATGTKGARFVDEYLDGNRTLAEAIDIFPLASRNQALQIVIILRAIDVLAIHDHASDADKVADPGVLLDRELEELAKKDLFAQAGLHWSSHVDDFQAAMDKLEQNYGPGGKLANDSEKAARLCITRLDMAREAQRFLKDRANRTKHRREVVGEYQMKNSADLLFKQAQLRLLKQEVRKAKQLIETAIELDPKQEYITKLNSF